MRLKDWLFGELKIEPRSPEITEVEPVKMRRSVMAPPGDVITCSKCGTQGLEVRCAECGEINNG